MSSTFKATQALSISCSLVASGGIAALSLFDVPELQAQPASRSLPSVRWLFSRGSHIFPSASVLSGAGFAYLAIQALPQQTRALSHILKLSGNGMKANGYLAAAVLTLSIRPWTSLAMIPTNFELIEMNDERGGKRSERSAKEGGKQAGSADASVDGQGEVDQFKDLSKPQEKTGQNSSTEDDEKVRSLLGKFGRLNMTRAVLLAAGGVVGLVTALA